MTEFWNQVAAGVLVTALTAAATAVWAMLRAPQRKGQAEGTTSSGQRHVMIGGLVALLTILGLVVAFIVPRGESRSDSPESKHRHPDPSAGVADRRESYSDSAPMAAAKQAVAPTSTSSRPPSITNKSATSPRGGGTPSYCSHSS